jgi:lactate permease
MMACGKLGLSPWWVRRLHRGQLPVAIYLGPYLSDVVGSILYFAVLLLLLLKVWRPATLRGYGGAAVSAPDQAKLGGGEHELSAADVPARLTFMVLIAVVVLWTAPWSPMPKSVAI